mmetsp:Transcript_31570/g.56504  ORF Transcript_31570/g.56504 Transcript_31570/m.56504 type:complete len:208 (-) Transcript_31570:101-724(-)
MDAHARGTSLLRLTKHRHPQTLLRHGPQLGAAGEAYPNVVSEERIIECVKHRHQETDGLVLQPFYALNHRVRRGVVLHAQQVGLLRDAVQFVQQRLLHNPRAALQTGRHPRDLLPLALHQPNQRVQVRLHLLLPRPLLVSRVEARLPCFLNPLPLARLHICFPRSRAPRLDYFRQFLPRCVPALAPRSMRIGHYCLAEVQRWHRRKC